MSSRLDPIDPYALAGATLRERCSIDSFVGLGRFGVVYAGTELATERAVALRFLKARPTLTSSERTVLVERLRGLMQPVIDLAEHAPTMADVLDVTAMVTSEGRWMPVVVHAWAEGQTLESLLATERQRGVAPRSIRRAIELLSPVADVVQYAHARGVVHGSLSPRSLFVKRRSEGAPSVVVGDLGLARATALLQSELRAFGEHPATMHTFATAYGAPEQFSTTRGQIGPATDVFALALLVVELVTDLPPLGDGDDEELERAAVDPVLRPTAHSAILALGPYVETVLERALAVRLEDRYASVASFWDALRAASHVLLRGSSSSITPPPLPASAMPPIPRSPSIPSVESLTMRSIATTRSSIPTPRPIPASEFFAPREHDGVRAGAAVSLDDVADVTNPLFGTNLRSVAPTAMDAPTPSERAAEARSNGRSQVAMVITAAFALGAGGAALARGATRSHPVFASTPLPPDVIAAAAAIEPPSAAAVPCPGGMVRVPGATVALRDARAKSREVAVEPFCVDALDVTVAQFQACSDPACKMASPTNAWAGISRFEQGTFDPLCNARDAKTIGARGNHPMNCVDWKTASAYCASRGARLPSDAEWELAARGTDGRRFPWGNDAPSAKLLDGCGAECVAWSRARGLPQKPLYDADDGFPTTAPVGSFPQGASPYGLLDAAGNVWEWTSDGVGRGGKGDKTTRGGAWDGAHADWSQGGLRWHAPPSTRSYAIGFRCAANAP